MPRTVGRGRSEWGTIIEIVPGKKYGIRWTENTPSGRKKVYETFYGNLTGARKRRSEIRERVSRQGRGDVVPTFGYAFERWYLPAARSMVESGAIKPVTLDQYVGAWERNIRDRWSDVPVTEIKPIDIESWLLGIAKSSGALSKAVMSNVFNECMKRGVLQSNPTKVKMVESSDAKTLDKGIYTLEELDDIAWRLRGRPCQMSVILMAFGSCRPGESLGPKLSEVSRRECMGMEFAEICINRQVRAAPYGMSDDFDLKTGSGKRRVYVPEPWCREVFRRVEEARREDVYLSDMGYGVWTPQKRVSGDFDSAFADGTLPYERHPWKNLRPSWETWMNWRNHVPLQKIKKLIGHSGGGVTEVYYDRPLDVQLMETIAGSFREHPFRSPHGW